MVFYEDIPAHNITSSFWTMYYWFILMSVLPRNTSPIIIEDVFSIPVWCKNIVAVFKMVVLDIVEIFF